jgi:hypothetical protein
MITKGNQVHGVNHVNSTGNTDFGYTGGGYNIPSGAGTSNIQRTDYSNDEAITLDKGDLSAVRFGLYAAGNINFGYFAGGREPSAPGHTTVFRSTYASDTAVTSPKGPLTTIRTHGIGSLGNAHFGYFGGAGVLQMHHRKVIFLHQNQILQQQVMLILDTLVVVDHLHLQLYQQLIELITVMIL